MNFDNKETLCWRESHKSSQQRLFIVIFSNTKHNTQQHWNEEIRCHIENFFAKYNKFVHKILLAKSKTEVSYYQGKRWTHLKFDSIILHLQTNCSVCGYIILYNIYIIVPLTEVLCWIPKSNMLHSGLVYCWNCSRVNFNIRLLLCLVRGRGLDMSSF